MLRDVGEIWLVFLPVVLYGYVAPLLCISEYGEICHRDIGHGISKFDFE